MTDNPISPKHYRPDNLPEVGEIMRRTIGNVGYWYFCQGNALKYRLRAGKKQTADFETDIRKAQWYEQRAELLWESMSETERAIIQNLTTNSKP
jgi:hypothetical protein